MLTWGIFGFISCKRKVMVDSLFGFISCPIICGILQASKKETWSYLKSCSFWWRKWVSVLSTYLPHFGISHCLTCLYSSEQNGIVERKHKHIVELGITFLAQASIPHHYWYDAFFTAVFLINRLSSYNLSKISQHEKLFSYSPDYSFFLCLCISMLSLACLHFTKRNSLSDLKHVCSLATALNIMVTSVCQPLVVFIEPRMLFCKSLPLHLLILKEFFPFHNTYSKFHILPCLSNVWFSMYVSV